MIYLSICETIVIFLIGLIIFYETLNIYQQEHYDFSKLVLSFKSLYLKNITTIILYLILLLKIYINIFHIVAILLLGLMAIGKRHLYIIKLKYTKRVLRLILTSILIMVIPFLIISKHHNYLLLISILLAPFIIYGANIINKPLEKYINYRYCQKATKKLKAIPQLLTIGITGSFGKTTTKNILENILSPSYLTISSPKSYNTLMGVVKTINESLKNHHEIFICEMGAYRIGDIEDICKLIVPDISVITDIGPQHLGTFKTIDNVLKAKLEIVKYQSYDKTIILNGNNEYLKNATIHNVKDVIYIGLDNTCQYYAKDLDVTGGNLKFTIVNGHQNIEIETKLLGRHNVINILLAYGVIQSLVKENVKISNSEFAQRIKEMAPIEHRLEYSYHDGFHIYDDSYNANITGFKNAIEVISLTKTKKVIITPGIVDSGQMLREINEEIAKAMIGVFDEICLIRNASAEYISNYLHTMKQPHYLYKSFQEAYQHLKNIYTNEEISVLIANDLPDNFLRRAK